MNPAHSHSSGKFFTLKQASKVLEVSIDTLLEWNNSNILKPTITQEGKVVYSKEQLNKFLTIQKQLNRNSLNKTQTSDSINVNILQTSYRDKINSQTAPNSYKKTSNKDEQNIISSLVFNKSTLTDSKNDKSTVNKSINLYPRKRSDSNIKKRYYGMVFTVFVILVSIVIQNKSVLFSNNNRVESPNKSSDIKATSKSKVSEIDLMDASVSDNLVFSVDNNTDDSENPLITVPESNIATAFSVYEQEQSATEESNPVTSSAVPLVTINTKKEDGGTNSNLIDNFASRSNLQTDSKNENQIFDKEGNLIGEVDNEDILATNLGLTSLLSNSQPLNKTITRSILITSMTLVLLWTVYYFSKQPAFLNLKTDSNKTSQLNSYNDKFEKVFEINQKTDGSVVLLYQGAEHKVSKPELNSETDMLIQRLLELAGEDNKEINYDILEDEKIKLNSPLSKIVTRLGFVGTKRDLFFPRTSKNKIVFRRFITKEDLDSMNLTNDEISNKLLN